MNKGLGIAILLLVLVGGGVLYLMGRDGTDSLPLEYGDQSEQTQDTTQDVADDTTETDTGSSDAGGSDTTGTDTDNTTTGGSSTGDTGSATTVTVVTYTDEGFSPASVTISTGQSVTFKNESSRAFWPASAIHPTHALYPEKTDADCLGSSFDACDALQPGDSYTFTFNSAGSWSYHDHLRANERGTVIVN